jgi:D-beta-D-heptose 7-phosphate kinase/D-beta-D-heptose 1-phosphate adenosyltransferase
VPIFSMDDAAAHADLVHACGGRVVFTNGVFDLLHNGHLRYLQQSRELGDTLVVGVNSDRSVRAIKGPSRPVTPELERAEMLAALSCVDIVVLFDEDTPSALIARLRPDVLVKGADWAGREIPGQDIVEKGGGRIVLAPFESGYSTTNIIDTVRKR